MCRPPGPRSRSLAADLTRFEAPRVNTWIDDSEPPVVWHRAVGSNILDVDGNRYLDLTAGFGVASIGHRHPRVVEAVRRQSGELVHGLADVAAHPARIELARRLTALAPIPDAQLYFAVSGSDAVEIAIKSAWLATGRAELLAFEPGYHGTTLGSLSLASRPDFRRPFAGRLLEGVSRLPHGGAITEVEALLRHGSFAAAVVEPIVGREGVTLPPAGWLAELAATCRAHGTLLVADEIFTGFGRTGSLFVTEAEGVLPDVLCCGKALGGGLPIAAVVAPRSILSVWDRPGEALHTATFLAHPLACVAALAALEVIESEGLAERARQLGRRLESHAASWIGRCGVVSVVGRGLLWTLGFDTVPNAKQLARRALDHGLLSLASGRRLQIVPPLVVTDAQWEFVLDTFDALLEGSDEPLGESGQG